MTRKPKDRSQKGLEVSRLKSRVLKNSVELSGDSAYYYPRGLSKIVRIQGAEMLHDTLGCRPVATKENLPFQKLLHTVLFVAIGEIVWSV